MNETFMTLSFVRIETNTKQNEKIYEMFRQM